MSKPPSRPNVPSANLFAPRPVSGTVGLPGSVMTPTVRIPGQGLAQNRAASTQGKPTAEEIKTALHRGGALFAAKRFAEAEEVARLILRFEPKQADAMHLLGLVLLAVGKADEAERLMLRALKLAGPHPRLYVNLGNAARGRQNTERAHKYYNQALDFDPLYEDALLERGITYTDSRRFLEAADAFDQLLYVNPTSLAAFSGAAHVASELGQFRKSIEYCERAIEECDEAPIEMLAMIAVNHERLSELEPAIAMAERVLALKPDHGACLRVWSKAKRRLAKRDPEILKSLKQRLESIDIDTMSIDDQRVVYSELAQICDELGEVDVAFDYFVKQGVKTLEAADKVELDRVTFINEVENLNKSMTPEMLARVQANSKAAPREEGARVPVFIVGFPRSGTTLLDQILDANPDVQVIEEQPLVRTLRRAMGDLPGGFLKNLPNLKDAQRKKLQEAYWREMEKYEPDFSKRVIIDKMPLSIVHIAVIAAVFPDAKIILALRHPADSCLSCFMQDFEMNGAMLNFTSVEQTAYLYDQVMTLWQRYASGLTLNVREVRYEKLITDLRGEVEPVLNFLGLEWDEAMADPAAHARARGTIRTPSYAQVTQPIYSTSADRWRRYEKHIAPMMPKLEKHIRHFGYSL